MTPEANFIYGLIHKKMNNLLDAQDGFSVATLTPSFRNAANLELAKLFLLKGDIIFCWYIRKKSDRA
jgi:hypothetical protein